MTITHSFYYPKLTLYNPHSYDVEVYSYKMDPNGTEVKFLLTVPHNQWRFVPDLLSLRTEAGRKGLIVLEGTGPVFPPPPTTTWPTTDQDTDPSKDVYEELILISAAVKTQGFFEVEPQIAEYHWDSTEFIPEGGIQQIYGIGYTIVNSVPGKSRVIFDNAVFGGPTTGISSLLDVGEHVSFRYKPR